MRTNYLELLTGDQILNQ